MSLNPFDGESHRTNPPHEFVRVPLGQGGPRYRTGWWIATNDQTGDTHPEAWVMPASDDWVDVYPALTWWQAMATAIRLSDELLDCKYVGGPDAAD